MKVEISNIKYGHNVYDLVMGASTVIFDANLSPKHIFCNIDLSPRVRDSFSAFREKYNDKKLEYVFATDFGNISLYTTNKVPENTIVVTDDVHSVL